jgi:hypothetical protein
MEIPESATARHKNGEIDVAVLIALAGLILATLLSFSLYLQCKRLARLRRPKKEETKDEESFSYEDFGGIVRGKHRQSSRELSAQLQEMRETQRDVKGELAGLQILASQLSKQRSLARSNQIKQQSSKKGN